MKSLLGLSADKAHDELWIGLHYGGHKEWFWSLVDKDFYQKGERKHRHFEGSSNTEMFVRHRQSKWYTDGISTKLYFMMVRNIHTWIWIIIHFGQLLVRSDNICFVLTTPASVWDHLIFKGISSPIGSGYIYIFFIPVAWNEHLFLHSKVEKHMEGEQRVRGCVLFCSFLLSLYNSYLTYSTLQAITFYFFSDA